MVESETGRVAIVTGGGRGMGAAIARELAARGYRLAILTPSESGPRVAKDLGGLGLRGSVAEPADLKALVARTLEAYGRIDALVNNPGHLPAGELLEIPDETWTESFQLVLMSVIWMSRLVTPVMIRQGGGAIVNVTTASTFEPTLRFPVSATFRAGISAFTKLHADRYSGQGVRMNCLLPGAIDSIAHREDRPDGIALRRIGTVAEVAKATAFLLSDAAGYIVGQSLRVDGGETRHV
ncbi:MAG: SDR family oxidoreductase [Kiloniellales bacterium]|nr:SDR family oxidoreductase [Kiloniellales bacterium]